MSPKFAAGLFAAILAGLASMPATAIPYGTYQQSCKDIKLKDRDSDSARIQARCRDSRGEWRKTSFELDRCWGDLTNVDGELVCVADRRHGGQGFPGQGDYPGQGYQQGYAGQGYPGQSYPGQPPVPTGKPKDVAVDVCIDWAVREAYRSGAGYAQLLKIEDVDRKDAGRIKVKGVITASDQRESRRSHDMPFRCDSRQGQILEFRWR